MSFKNAIKQIEHNPVKFARFMKFNKPKERKFGRNAFPCRRCGKTEGVITKYGLQYCRQCFREVARDLGFEKFE